ncbi:aminoglycoside 3-N-acetyltransferase [Ancylobacter terrae]|uniref:aminoglycoside 3-N-acetyltransferase n=1 Tax=Ancylobacter sp. sgz301288 TaxID=3342077 RepID=UPI0038594D9C
MPDGRFHSRASLAADLWSLGLQAGDTVMVHAAMSRFGPLLNGPDAFIGALLDVLGPTGTLVAYTDWDGAYEPLLDADGCLPERWRPHVPPFDPATSRAIRDNGILAEFIRTTPGARRSGNPGASVAAIGALSAWIVADHPLDYGYGDGSPLAKLVAAGGRVLMAGAPWETMTLLHHAEHLARIPGKRIRRYEAPLAGADGTLWRMIEEYETGDPVVPGLPDDYFDAVVRDFVAAGNGAEGNIAQAPALLVEAAPICAFAMSWLEMRCGP